MLVLVVHPLQKDFIGMVLQLLDLIVDLVVKNSYKNEYYVIYYK
jgi:hypothetical protein